MTFNKLLSELRDLDLETSDGWANGVHFPDNDFAIFTRSGELGYFIVGWSYRSYFCDAISMYCFKGCSFWNDNYWGICQLSVFLINNSMSYQWYEYHNWLSYNVCFTAWVCKRVCTIVMVRNLHFTSLWLHINCESDWESTLYPPIQVDLSSGFSIYIWSTCRLKCTRPIIILCHHIEFLVETCIIQLIFRFIQLYTWKVTPLAINSNRFQLFPERLVFGI